MSGPSLGCEACAPLRGTTDPPVGIRVALHSFSLPRSASINQGLSAGFSLHS